MSKSLIISGIIILTFLYLLLSNALPFLSGIKGHHPVVSGKIDDCLQAVNTEMSSFYVITQGKTVVCIDTGSNLKRAKKELTKLKINPDQWQRSSSPMLTRTMWRLWICSKMPESIFPARKKK